MSKKKKEMYEHLKHFEVEEILPFIGKFTEESKRAMAISVEEKRHLVMTHSARLRLFKRSDRTCVCCGRVGNTFVLDRQLGHQDGRQDSVHLNLYCYNPGSKREYVLMTKDHIIPRSFGGSNSPDNLQVMCIICNGAKANNITRLDLIEILSTKKGRKRMISNSSYRNNLKKYYNKNNILYHSNLVSEKVLEQLSL
jgi:hypothetical protein